MRFLTDSLIGLNSKNILFNVICFNRLPMEKKQYKKKPFGVWQRVNNKFDKIFLLN